MEDAWLEMIKTNVYEYLSTVEYNHPDFNINEFKNNLSKIIGMQPAVKINWDTKEKINELKKAAGATNFIDKIEKAKDVEIVFINAEQKPITLKFLF